MSDLDERLARVGLAAALEPGSVACARAVGIQGSQEAWRRARQGVLGEPARERARSAEPERLLEEGGRAGWRYVIPGDEEWPAQVEELAFLEPIHDLVGPPLGLWVRGAGSLNELCRQSVAIVGSRASSSYGELVATDLAVGLARAGVCVVSGGAYGIDAAAHRGSLAADGPTVCVLASGVDMPYPAGHAGLIDRIAGEGAVVSEYPPGTHPVKMRFLARNRLIAALTQGLILVEAAARSGARNTVNWAQSLGRAVMAVPGPVTSSLSVGPHLLLRDGGASLVTCEAEVLDIVHGLGQATLLDAAGERRAADGLDPDAAAVLEAVPARGARTAEILALEAGLSWPATAAVLTRLEAAGFIRLGDAGYTLLRRGDDPVGPARATTLVPPAGPRADKED